MKDNEEGFWFYVGWFVILCGIIVALCTLQSCASAPVLHVIIFPVKAPLETCKTLCK